MIKKNVIGLSALLLSNFSLADVNHVGNIKRIIVEQTKIISVWLTTTPAVAECSADNRWIIDVTNDPMAKEKYSALLAAAASGKTVGLQHLSISGCGAFNAKKIFYVDVAY